MAAVPVRPFPRSPEVPTAMLLSRTRSRGVEATDFDGLLRKYHRQIEYVARLFRQWINHDEATHEIGIAIWMCACRHPDWVWNAGLVQSTGRYRLRFLALQERNRIGRNRRAWGRMMVEPMRNPYPNPLRAAIAAEERYNRRLVLRRVLAECSAKARESVHLRVCGLRYLQIGLAVGISPATVGTHCGKLGIPAPVPITTWKRHRGRMVRLVADTVAS
jgi:DNA-binding CsgD family transcriptional regulator